MFPDLCPLLVHLGQLIVRDFEKHEILVICAISSRFIRMRRYKSLYLPNAIKHVGWGFIRPARGESSVGEVSVDALALLDEFDTGEYVQLLDSKHVAMLGSR